ncbi:MAG: hypothetical protein H6662_18420 [Ardenticatenaceae bacterium]|nr:hypothetical protein [Anaerolineales bacterium]MCB8923566.1 hypothetical protein [Ardenticatenaceae bacterium]MCB8991715.1 hypothetical protein [Ardenticatenaceae bacterium]
MAQSTSTSQIFGHWEAVTAVPTTTMSLDAAQLSAHWRRNSLSSDYWAAYAALHIPETVPAGWLRRDDVSYVLSYLLNELFENCAKFSAGPELAVHFQAWLLDERMVFQLTNHIKPQGERPFITLIEELLNGDPDELYFQKLEANAEQDLGGSGLGYLTLIKDYGIQFGFRFQRASGESTAVTVQAHVNLREPS